MTNSINEDMLAIKDKFDFSDYPVDHPCYSKDNMKVVGKFKDEMAGVPIQEFIGLRAKMYSIQLNNDVELKRAKGITHNVVNKNIKHADFPRVLKDSTQMRHEMNLLLNRKHTIYGVTMNKISLSAYDDKRYLLDDGITSLSYGHYNISKVITDVRPIWRPYL